MVAKPGPVWPEVVMVQAIITVQAITIAGSRRPGREAGEDAPDAARPLNSQVTVAPEASVPRRHERIPKDLRVRRADSPWINYDRQHALREQHEPLSRSGR